jgi:hypothetical protein
MRYEGESRSWNWDKHCTKFHQQIQLIDEWAVARLATPLSVEDHISAFLKTTPKDCKNSELLIAKGIIEGDQSRFPTLVGNVIPHLTLSIDPRSRVHPPPNTLSTTPALHLDMIPRSIATLGRALGGDLVGRPLGSATWSVGKRWEP